MPKRKRKLVKDEYEERKRLRQDEQWISTFNHEKYHQQIPHYAPLDCWKTGARETLIPVRAHVRQFLDRLEVRDEEIRRIFQRR